VGFQNVDGLPAKLNNNSHLDTTKEVADDLQLDAFAFAEHRNNLKHRDNRRYGVTQLFQGGEAMVRGIWGCNKHENTEEYNNKRTMEGGTGMVAFGELASCMYRDNSGVDDSGLARWTYMEFRGRNGHSTMMLVGYNPCKNNKKDSGTTYQQHRRYFINKEKEVVEPRKRFLTDLLALLSKWREEGKRIIVYMDANEHVYKGAIGKALTDSEGLDMVEAVQECNGAKLGATHFRGSKPIDAIWATKDLEITNACAMPIGYGPGDHRMIVVDFTTVSLVGEDPQVIVRPGARRLNSKCPVSLRNYNRVLEELLSKHQLTEKMVAAHAKRDQDPKKFKDVMNKVDQQSKEFMTHAEKKCRKLKCGKIPFSPEAAEWIKRCQFYRTLLRALSGKKCNRGNFKRLARRLNISNPLSLPVEEVVMRLRECKQQCKYFQIHGQKYRRKFLNKRLEAAREKQDVEAEQRILQIIARERDRAFWRRLNYSLGKQRGTSVSSVQVKTPEGDTVELKTQEEVQNAIWKEVHQSRYHLAEEAPICKGKLRGQFGYNAESLAARQVLNGSYQFEDDFHEATITSYPSDGGRLQPDEQDYLWRAHDG
jgi:hypothetical protein